MVPRYVPFGTYHGTMVLEYLGTYTHVLIMLCHDFLIGKGHPCALRTTCVLGARQPVEREGANAGQHTTTLSLPPSHHCLGLPRHYNVCEHVGLDANQRRALYTWYMCIPQHLVKAVYHGIHMYHWYHTSGTNNGTYTCTNYLKNDLKYKHPVPHVTMWCWYVVLQCRYACTDADYH